MKDKRIEASQALSKLPGMDRARYAIAKINNNYLEYQVIPTSSKKCRYYKDDVIKYIAGPWLRIEDGNLWSSFEILKQANHAVIQLNFSWHLVKLSKEWNDSFTGVCGYALTSAQELGHCSIIGPETAYILGICKLYEVDSKAYRKGMEALLK